MIAPSRSSSGGRTIRRFFSQPADRIGALRPWCCLIFWSILAQASGCAWWREYRDTFAYSQGLYRKAIESESKGKSSEAITLLRQSIEANPDDPEIRWELARVLLDQGQTASALEELRYLVKHYPDDSRAYLSLARTLLQRGRFDDAAELADLALELDSRSTEGLLLRAQIAEARDDTNRALETYHHVLLQQPENAEVRLRLCRLQVQLGNGREASALLRETLANVPISPQQTKAAHWLLGLCYAQEERWQEAAVALDTGISREHATAENRYELAYALYRAGDSERARAELAAALQQEPKFVAAREMLASLNAASDELSLSPDQILPANHSTR